MQDDPRLVEALRRADAAGNADDARRLAQAIADGRRKTPSAKEIAMSRGEQDIADIVGEREYMAGLNQPQAAPQSQSMAGQARDTILRSMDERTGFGPIPDAAARFGKGVGATAMDFIARPVGATVEAAEYTLGTPFRFAGGAMGTTQAVREGRFKDAATEAGKTALAGAETALLALPGPKGAPRPPVARPMTQAEQVMQAASRSNIDIPPAAVVQAPGVKSVTKSISESAFAGGGVRKNVGRATEQTEQRLQEIARMYGDTSISGAGTAAKQGVTAFDRRAGRLYDDFETSLPEGAMQTPVQPSATRARLVEAGARYDTPELQELFDTPIRRKLNETLQKADVSISDLRELRSDVRRAQAKPGAAKTENDFELERLEGVLTEDIYRAVGEVSPRSLVLMKRADAHYRGTKQTLQKALEPFTRKADKTPEQAFNSIVAAMEGQTTGGGRADFQRIRALRRALSGEQLDDVAGAILANAGRARGREGAEFSVQQFRTQWQKWGEQQKNVMFGGVGTARRQALEDLVTVAGRLADIEDAANVSRSGVNIQNMLTLGGIGVNAPATAAAVLTQATAGRLLSNPKHTRVMVQLFDGETRALRAAQAGNIEAARKILQSSRTKAAAAIAAMEDIDMAARQEAIRALMPANENAAPPSGQQTGSTMGQVPTQGQ